MHCFLPSDPKLIQLEEHAAFDMSQTTNIFSRGAGDADAASTAVWDDSELIAAWNAQLRRIQTEKSQQVVVQSSTASNSESDEDVEEESEVSGDDIAIDLDGGDDAVAAAGRQITAASTGSAGLNNSTKRSRDDDGDVVDDDNNNTSTRCDAHRLMPPVPQGVGRGVEAMLRAWFMAGYETGRYAAAS